MKPIMTNKFPEIVKAYRSSQGLSLRDFAVELSAGLPNDGVTYQSIHNWEIGEHGPKHQIMVILALHSSGWRRDFGFDCLAALQPEDYQPIGPIGRRILGDGDWD